MSRKEPAGGAYERRGQFFVRITVGPQARASELVPWARSLEQAVERARVLQAHVNRLRAAKRPDFIARVIEVGAKADDAKLIELAASIEGMLEGALVAAPTSGRTFADATKAWLAATSSLYDERTAGTFRLYANHWGPFFANDLRNISTQSLQNYINERLKKVLRLTVKKEMWGLRTFVTWAVEAKLVPEIVKWPRIPKKALGTRSGPQRVEIVELTLEQVERLLALLPDHVRPRYTFAAETGLRPATIDQISVPEHYTRGAAFLTISAEADKNRYARKVPLSDRARAILEAAAPERGLVFGRTRYIDTFKKTVLLAGLPKETAPYDLRHARATHDVEASGNINGVAYLLGHKHVTTTSRYVHANEKSAAAVIASRSPAPTSPDGNPETAAVAADVSERPSAPSQRRESTPRKGRRARSGTGTAMCRGSSPLLRTTSPRV